MGGPQEQEVGGGSRATVGGQMLKPMLKPMLKQTLKPMLNPILKQRLCQPVQRYPPLSFQWHA
jgi:hypothetical protein